MMCQVLLKACLAAALPAGAMAAGLTSRSYVQNGLVVQFDGIENAGRGVHDPSAKIWKDLSGHGGDGTLKCLDGGTSQCWYDSYYRVRAAEKNWVHGTSEKFQSAINSVSATLDMCYTPESGHTGCWCGKTTRHLATAAGANNTLLVYARHSNIKNESNADMPRPNSKNQSFSLRLNSTCTVFTNGVAAMANRPVTGNDTGSPDFYVGINPQYTSVDDPSGTKYSGTTTRMYSLRLYDRPLTDAEIAFNAAIDDIRFRGEELGERKVLSIGASPYAFGVPTPAFGSSFVTGSSVDLSIDTQTAVYEDGVSAVPVSDGVRAVFEGAEIVVDGGAPYTNKSNSFTLELGTETSVKWILGNVQYRVVATSTGDATVSINGGESAAAVTNWCNAGETVVVSAKSALGNPFKAWSGDVSGFVADLSCSEISFVVDAPRAIAAQYNVYLLGNGSETYSVNVSDSAEKAIESRTKDSAESSPFSLETFIKGVLMMVK